LRGWRGWIDPRIDLVDLWIDSFESQLYSCGEWYLNLLPSKLGRNDVTTAGGNARTNVKQLFEGELFKPPACRENSTTGNNYY